MFVVSALALFGFSRVSVDLFFSLILAVRLVTVFNFRRVPFLPFSTLSGFPLAVVGFSRFSVGRFLLRRFTVCRGRRSSFSRWHLLILVGCLLWPLTVFDLVVVPFAVFDLGIFVVDGFRF